MERCEWCDFSLWILQLTMKLLYLFITSFQLRLRREQKQERRECGKMRTKKRSWQQTANLHILFLSLKNNEHQSKTPSSVCPLAVTLHILGTARTRILKTDFEATAQQKCPLFYLAGWSNCDLKQRQNIFPHQHSPNMARRPRCWRTVKILLAMCFSSSFLSFSSCKQINLGVEVSSEKKGEHHSGILGMGHLTKFIVCPS